MRTGVTSFGSSIGAGFSALCCLGVPAITGLLSAIGLGFVIHDAVLIPLMGLFLSVNLFVVYLSTKRHGRKWVLVISMLSAPLIISGLWISSFVVALGILGIFTASGLDFYYSRITKTSCRALDGSASMKGR